MKKVLELPWRLQNNISCNISRKGQHVLKIFLIVHEYP